MGTRKDVVSRPGPVQSGLVARGGVPGHDDRVRIMFFAQLRELTGVDRAELEVDGVREGELWELLERRWPALSPMRATTRVARNGVYAGPGEIFAAGDEVALIPPVSGG